ncbi:gamma-glutamylcyclotransferase family protein [Pelagovum pacificum]|uniref:Gamma-glutamylcyclotransferase n=1 Tax=Pelagovum pacificum TaxID=2588711 RepID=A0A5C5GGI8_9RHOB|nr:gamma-glutamylcyclotransferase family protein [Pelagovum pacificum]QQA43740.1 gamma-glutamylcyclotransferase [Pelagovum pacificum]TNY33129.1 gamma-glutamylcyclotransferase [Pelagovum pacificum]
MSTPRFFGYGSLVNLATHDYPNARIARLSGWRRVWRHSTLRPLAFLSVERHEDAEIEGVVADVPGADWEALDERERAYLRRDVTHEVTNDGERADTAVYEVAEGLLSPPDTAHPILLSYLETVILGYLELFGEDGVIRFCETTTGWHAPVMNDREMPIYPRFQQPTSEQRSYIDSLLRDLDCRLIAAEAVGS